MKNDIHAVENLILSGLLGNVRYIIIGLSERY